MVVFLLLGVIWAAVLVPPWLQARREARPIASIMSFRSQLWSLQRATPVYGDAAYGDAVYGDGVYGDAAYEVERAYGDDTDSHATAGGGGAAVHPFPAVAAAAPLPASATVMAPGLAAARRAHAFRRRQQILTALVVLTVGATVPAVLVSGPWIVAAAAAGSLLVLYLALLIRRGRREVERARKVRYLTPIRAPRPSVVVIGSGAVR